MRKFAALVLAAFLAQSVGAAPLVRVKDIAHLKDVRDNQLVGYGIVVGLTGTGDSSRSGFTIMSILSMLDKLGINLVTKLAEYGVGFDANNLSIQNAAAVVVTATLPPYASNGQKLDAVVSAVGDAKSLEGGILLQTPLLGADGRIYSVAQGAISLGGGAAIGSAGRQAAGAGQHKTVGRIAQGAIVERDMSSTMVEPDGSIVWLLKRPDFATASRMTEAINAAYRPPIARAENAERIRVSLPANYRNNPVGFIARIEDILLQPDEPARVIVNERTGTIVFGENVRISTVAVSHGGLTVSIKGEAAPNIGTTQQVSAATISVEEEKENTLTLPEGTSVRDLVRALNSIGAVPRDIIAILQVISAAGALHAELTFL